MNTSAASRRKIPSAIRKISSRKMGYAPTLTTCNAKCADYARGATDAYFLNTK